MYKIYDLSLPIKDGATEPNPPKITRSPHESGPARLGKIAGIQPEDFPYDTALATDVITAGAHNGTHVDAPYHYGAVSEGKPALTIDEIPLEWCVGDGVVLDMRHKKPGDEITAEDLEKECGRIGYRLKAGDIPLIQTGCDTDTKTYLAMQSGLGVQGLKWLLEKGIRCIGIDAWTLDRPVPAMVKTYRETGDKLALWPTHFYGRTKSYLQIEKLCGLDRLPKPYGFTVLALPIKIDRGTAGWCRAVAVYETDEDGQV